MSYLYIIAAADPAERTMFKLGYSRSPQTRLKQLQTANPIKLIILATCKGSYKQERELHHWLCTSRLVGEWFQWSDKVNLILDRWQSKTT